MREELQGTSVDALFQRGEAERLLGRPKAQEDLEKITKSERGDHRLRVLAHELLMLLGKSPDPKMVRIYCEAIDGAFMHNWWALPGHHLGRLGETLVQFGEPALPYLIKDLDNPTVLTCLGPDAPVNRERHYTVADLAAYLICEILERPFPDGMDPEGRKGPRADLYEEINERLANERRK
jgi:hypothetical protein